MTEDEPEAKSERWLGSARAGFELESSVAPDDALLVARITRALEKRHVAGGRRADRLRLAAGIAIGVLLSAAAGGAFELSRSLLGRSSDSTPPAVRPALPAVDAPRTGVTPPAAPARQIQPAVVPSAEAPAARGAAAAPRIPTSAAPPESAAELFSSANRARSQGDPKLAVRLYERLGTRFTGSAEAEAARISLGALYLQRGDAARALGEFRAYRSRPGNPLGAEALWGEIEANHALGRTAEEQRLLRELLRDYPGSAYAAAARKRIPGDDGSTMGQPPSRGGPVEAR